MTLVVLAVLVAGLMLVRDEGPGAAAPRVAAPTPPVAAVTPSPPALPVPPGRNVFEYAAPPAAWVPRPVARPPAPVTAETTRPAPPRPVRLVGVVHRGGLLKAALALGGEVVMLGVGEERDGYRVESIDEDAGVRVTGPGGAAWVLLPD